MGGRPIAERDFGDEIAGLRRIALDTSACVYYLSRIAPWSVLAAQIFERAVGGTIDVQLSSIVELELLVRPYRDRNRAHLMSVRSFLSATPGVRLRRITPDVIDAAARVRAQTRLKIADAIIVASAAVERCEAVIGNDKAFRVINADARRRPRYIHLDDYVSGA